MQRQPVRIDDIPAEGTELADEQLASVVGGLMGKPGEPGTSGTDKPNGDPDHDADF